MKGYKYIDKNGTFQLDNPEMTSYLYFPIANENGVMGSVTPLLGGDSKTSQNTFLLEPVSSEDLHSRKSSRNFWCKIKGKGIWSATGMSSAQQAKTFTKEKETTNLTAGLMWHEVTRESKEYGMAARVTSFVPHSGEMVEIMIVAIKNIGDEPLTVSPVAAIPLYGRSADNIRDHRHVTSLLHRIETRRNGVVLNPTLTFDERGHHVNQVVYGVFGGAMEGEEPIGYYPVVEDFIGEGGTFENPKALYQSEPELIPEGIQLEGMEALGGIAFKEVELHAGYEKTYIIAIGYGNSTVQLEREAGRFLTGSAAIRELGDTKKYWTEKVNVSYQSGDQNFDAWMKWVNFQPMLRRIYGCSFLPHHDYGRGGRGWRDLWQDCLALLIMNPEGVRQMLLDNFGGVRMDGTNATIIGRNQGEFVADRNSITRVWMDHGVWPLLTTNLYIEQSGDIRFLLEENYYFKDPQVMRGKEFDRQWSQSEGNHLRTVEGKEYRGSILEHMLIQNLTAYYDVGEHNHIRLRDADWNDALDMANERGESVAFTAAYAGNLRMLSNLLNELHLQGVEEVTITEELLVLLDGGKIENLDPKGKQEVLHRYCSLCRDRISGKQITYKTKALASNLHGKSNWIKEHIQHTEWITSKENHSWFNGYYDNSGERVEGDHKNGVRMMLTSQVFTIMSGTALNEQVHEIINSCDTYLYDARVGGYRLNTNFHEVKTNLGRMFGFAYGQKENGAVFSHMSVMYANALYQRGFAREGYKVIHTLYQHCSDFEKSRIYPGIPEYIGENQRGLYHYLTGAASWLLLTVLTEMFGVKGSLGDLVIEPKLVLEQFDKNSLAEVGLTFARKQLLVQYENPGRKEYGEYQIGNIAIDGTIIDIDGMKTNGMTTNEMATNEMIINKLTTNEGVNKLSSFSKVKLPRKDIEALDSNMEHRIKVKLV